MNTFEQRYLMHSSPIDNPLQNPKQNKNNFQFTLSNINTRSRGFSASKTVGHRKPSISELFDFSTLVFKKGNFVPTSRENKENRGRQPQQLSFKKGQKLKLKKKHNQAKLTQKDVEIQIKHSIQQNFLPLSQNNLFDRKQSPKSLTRDSTESDSFQNTSKTKSKSYVNQIFSDYIIPQTITQPLKISDFELGQCIGSGKFGDVHICRHKRTNFIFALKKILKHTIIENKMLDQFINQLKIQYSLDHENVVKLYAHFDDEYHMFLLMEYAPGGTLMSHIYNSENYTADVLEQMLNAVSYVHRKNIIHRDIKPENIVICFDSTFKICDFGLSAYLRNRHDARTSFCGTLDYIAPQMKNKGVYSYSVDIWGLGVLCYQVLFGKAPFKEEISNWKKNGSNRHNGWNWNISFRSYISAAATSFMSSLLKENPNERMGLVSALQSQFILKRKEKESILTETEKLMLRQQLL